VTIRISTALINTHLKGHNYQLHAFRSNVKQDVILQTLAIIPEGPSIYAYCSSIILNAFECLSFSKLC